LRLQGFEMSEEEASATPAEEPAAPPTAPPTAEAEGRTSRAKSPPVAPLEVPTDDTDHAEETAKRVEAIIEEATSSSKRENQRAVELMWALTSAGPSDITEGLVTKGAVEVCVQMVNGGADNYIRKCALTTIANLLNCDERARSLLIDEGGLDVVLDAFKNKDRDIQKCGLRCVMNLVQHLETRGSLCNDAMFLKTLVKAGTKHMGDSNIQYMVAATLDTITRKDDFGAKVVNTPESLDCLIGLADPKMPDEVVAEAARALYNLIAIENSEIREVLISAGLTEVLQNIAANKPIEIRCAAADGLAILGNNADKIAALEAEYGLDFSYGKLEEDKDDDEKDDDD